MHREPPRRVRLTDAAIEDLQQLHRKNPQILRDIFAKLLLLERASNAGEPLVGALIGFRKLTVGNRAWRIIWRETTDESRVPVLDIAEVWAAGARADGEVYDEMLRRIEELKKQGSPNAHQLYDVVKKLGRLYRNIEAHPEPRTPSALPEWLRRGLRDELHLSHAEIDRLSHDQAQQLIVEHWSQEK